VPADIDAIVLKAMRHSAGERYASVGAFAADLRRWLEQRPVQARRGRRLYFFRRFVQRNRWPLAAGALLLLSVLGGLGASLYALGQARTQQRLAEQRQHQLERMVRFQQSMYDSVDIDAMGHAMLAATQRQVRGALAQPQQAADATKDAGPPSAALDGAFARVQATDIARSAFDTYVVSHTLDNLQHAFPDAPLLAADLRQSLARALLGIGSYAHAADELGKVVAVREREPGDPRGLLSARIDLARALEKQGRSTEAAGLYADCLRQSAALAPTDALRIAAEAGSARMLMAQGHLQQALQEQQTLLAGLKSSLPDTDHGLMQLRRDRVDTLIKLGQRDRARTELEQLVPLYRKTFGSEHPETLSTSLTLATLLYSQDNEYERSLALAKEVAAIRQRRLGAEHPATLQARALAASNEVRLAQDPATMAQVHQRLDAVIESYRRALGPDNPHTLDAMTDMVRLLSKQDRPGEAIAMERVVLAGRQRALGPDHIDTLYARGSLASLLCENGQYAEAGVLAEQVLDALRGQLGDDHPMTLATYDLVGRIDAGAGRWEQARRAHARALEGRARTLGDTDAHTIESASRLYAVLLKLHDDARARQVFDTYLEPVIAMNPDTLNASMRSVREEALDAVGK
jgi:serine/threonine-protein kinase